MHKQNCSKGIALFSMEVPLNHIINWVNLAQISFPSEIYCTYI